MSIVLKTNIAGIISSRSGVIVDTADVYKIDKHYNVIVRKTDNVFIITAEEAFYDVFINNEDDPSIVEQYVERDINTTRPWLFGLFKGGKRYVNGYCEKKERRKVEYITTNLTIKQ